MGRLFEGGTYSKEALILRTHTTATTGKRKREVGLVVPAISLQPSRKNWRTRRFWRENWMKERWDILTLNWKTSLLMKIHSRCWLRTALQWVQGIFIILWKYLNKGRTAAAVLIRGQRLLNFPPHVQRLIEGGAYSGAAFIRVNTVFSL